MDADWCSHADIDSGVPRAHQRVFAASPIVFDVVGFMPDFSGGGDGRDTMPAATFGVRRPVLDAAVHVVAPPHGGGGYTQGAHPCLRTHVSALVICWRK